MTLGLEVHDTGIGIPAGELPRLFKRFSQLQGSDLRQGGGGSGLGLAISERLVRLMGGNISVQSTLGKGSAFSVMLPVQVQADAPDAAAVPLAGRHVLVAEPNPVDQYVLRGQLEALGARVLVVGQAEAVAPALNAAWSAGQAYDTLILAQAFAEQLDINREPQALGPVRVVRTETQGSADMLVKPAGEVALLRAVAASVPLPASLAPPAPVAEPAAEPSRPLHVLLAEDNEINQLVASAMISSLGHELTLVVNGIEAVSAAATGGYDLVLMDMMMPGIDGPTATRAIRKLRGPAAEVYIIALTANATPEHRARCLQAGMNDFVTKPVTRQRLNEALQRYVHWAATRPGITP
jgi:CheY-like chemotaxis protein